MVSGARRLGLVVLAAGVFLQAHAALAQTKDDPLIGRWVLDRARSEFSGNVPEKQFLKHDRINREVNAAFRFGGKQLCRRRISP